MRKFFVLIILLISSLAYGQDAWKVCFFSISHDGKNTSDIVSRAVKSSVSGFLKRDFVLIDITNTTTILSKDDAYLIALSNGVEFAIFGYVSQQEQRMELVLELIDVANKLVKLSKSYDFFYDVDEIFNTIDTIVVDFTEGIKKVIPKYEETAVVEYREKIKQQQEKLEIPGTFTPSVYLSMQLMPLGDRRGNNIISLYPEISLKYQTTKGSLFGNGWFIGLNSILSFMAMNYATTNVANLDPSPMGVKINLYSGINLTDWLGIGIDMILFKEIDIIDYEQQGDRNILHISDRSIGMDFTPMIKFSFGNLDIPLFILIMNNNFQLFMTLMTKGIEDLRRDFSNFSMTLIEMRPLYKISKTLNIEAKIGIDILTYPLNLPGNTQPIEATFINPSLGISVSRSFSF
jgi:TolB-like protein